MDDFDQTDWHSAWDAEHERFIQETLRTSELTTVLKKFIARHKDDGNHTPGPGSRGCELCKLVLEAEDLLRRPINMKFESWLIVRDRALALGY